MKSKKGMEAWLVGLIITVVFLVIVLLWILGPSLYGWIQNAGGYVISQQSKF